jgi:hypothetical protein
MKLQSPPRLVAVLALGERVGVRGNGSDSNPTSRTTAGTAILLESSARAGGLPSGLICGCQRGAS